MDIVWCENGQTHFFFCNGQTMNRYSTTMLIRGSSVPEWLMRVIFSEISALVLSIYDSLSGLAVTEVCIFNLTVSTPFYLADFVLPWFVPCRPPRRKSVVGPCLSHQPRLFFIFFLLRQPSAIKLFSTTTTKKMLVCVILVFFRWGLEKNVFMNRSFLGNTCGYRLC